MSKTCTTGENVSRRLARIEAAVARLCIGLRVLSDEVGGASQLTSKKPENREVADLLSIDIPTVEFHQSTCTIIIDGSFVKLPAREFALMTFLAEECNGSGSALPKQDAAIEPFARFLKRFVTTLDRDRVDREQIGRWMKELLSESVAIEAKAESLRKVLSRMRKKLKAAGLQSKFSFLLPKPMAFGINVKLLGGRR